MQEKNNVENRDSQKMAVSLFDDQPFLFKEWLADTANITSNTALRVLIVLSQQPTQTGSGVYVRELVGELQKLGHQPHLLAAHYRLLTGNDFPFLPEDQIHTMLFSSGENADIAEISFPISGMSLDMPYMHLPFRELSSAMLEEYREAWVAKIRTIVARVRPHILHVNHLWLMAGIARTAVPWLPIVSTTHGSEFLLLKDAPAFVPIVGPGVQSLDAVMAVSTDTARNAVEILGVRPDRLHIIGNGYNPQLFSLTEPDAGEALLRELLSRYQPIPSWEKLVLYVGKFATYKGLPYLIRAAERYREIGGKHVITVIVGEGSQGVRSYLENLVASLGLQTSVFLPGKLPYEKIGPLMNRADVFVLPSLYEGFGLVLLEALACGVRSVASDRGGPLFFVPQILQEKEMVTLISGLNLLESGEANPADEERYVTDLAAAISCQLVASSSFAERQTIVEAIKHLTWTFRVKETTWIYFATIQQRRNAFP